MNKTFTHAGVSTLKGVTKVRFANNALRANVLDKNGHTDIDLIELPVPMTKEQAINHLISTNFVAHQPDYAVAATQTALDDALKALQPKEAAAPVEGAEMELA